MPTLRHARLTARLVLVAWVLSILGMMGLPLAPGQEGTWVCLGSGGAKLVLAQAAPAHTAGTTGTTGTTARQAADDAGLGSQMHCPLCASAALLTPGPQTAHFMAVGLSHVLRAAAPDHLRQTTAAHGHARGPPSL